MAKRDIEPVASTNQVVVYYRTGKYDTVLDEISIQERRINKWVADNNLEIVESVYTTDVDSRKKLEIALNHAKDYAGGVLIASPCRVSYNTEEFLRMYENTTAPIFIVDVSAGMKKSDSKMAVTMLMIGYQFYKDQCDTWVL